MKKILILIQILVVCLQLNFRGYAQSTIPGNISAAPPEWLGWNGGIVKALDIVNSHPNWPINFYTNAGPLAPWLLQKMIITATAIPATDGYVGIGLNFIAPQSRLHLHEPATGITLPVYTQWTNAATLATATDGLRVGIDLNGIAQFRQQENLEMDFFSNNAHRMRLHRSGQFSIATYLNVGTPPTQAATLNVAGDPTSFLSGLGWRTAIKVNNEAAIMFDNDDPTNTNRYYFIAHPSNNPVGHTYQGLIPNPDGAMIPQYIYKNYARTNPGQALQGTHQFGTGAYLWPLTVTGACAGGNSHILPPLLTNVPPMTPVNCNTNVWLNNFGLYQCEPFRGNIPLFPLGLNEGLVIADNNGVFNRKLRFSTNPLDVLQGDGTWGPGAGFAGAQNATWLNPINGRVEWGSGTGAPFTPLLHNTEVQMLNGAGGPGSEWSVYFTGQSTMANGGNAVNVGIGKAIGGPPLLAKLVLC